MSREGLRLRLAAVSMLVLETACLASTTPAVPPLRVCTFGTGKKCSAYGTTTLKAIEFLSPLGGPAVESCSCLARCNVGVVVKKPDGLMADRVNSPRTCANLLRSMGCTIDQRLVDAYSSALRGDELAAEERDEEALTAYKRAFSLAIAAGLGLTGRRPDWQSDTDARKMREPGAVYVRGEPRGSGGASGSESRMRGAAKRATPVQLQWLAKTLVSRSRVYSRLGRPTTAQPLGKVRSTRRALEDARYAVQLAESADANAFRRVRRPATLPVPVPVPVARSEDPPGLGEAGFALDADAGKTLTNGSFPSFVFVAGAGGAGAELEGVSSSSSGDGDSSEGERVIAAPVVLAAWERLAESFESARDVEGAIFAYERLLDLQPSSTPGLTAPVAAKRGVQEIVLLSHRRGLADATKVTTGLQDVGEDTRARITDRAMSDTETLRRVVERDCDTLEIILRKVGEGPLPEAAVERSLADLRMVRKLARSDINRLELTLLRGDPLLTFLRDVSYDLRKQLTGALDPSDAQPNEDTPVRDESELGVKLREQFDLGALPRDPLLVQALLEQAQRDPQLVARLVSEAKDARGQDVYARAAGGAVDYAAGAVASDEDADR